MLLGETSEGSPTMLELEVVPEHGLQGDAIEFLLGETIATTTLIITMVDLVLGPVRDPTAMSIFVALVAALNRKPQPKLIRRTRAPPQPPSTLTA